jgi:hypothetical protein
MYVREAQLLVGSVCMYVSIYLSIYACMYVREAQLLQLRSQAASVWVCMYVCMYVFIYVCMYVREAQLLRSDWGARQRLCIYTCMYVCMYVQGPAMRTTDTMSLCACLCRCVCVQVWCGSCLLRAPCFVAFKTWTHTSLCESACSFLCFKHLQACFVAFKIWIYMLVYWLVPTIRKEARVLPPVWECVSMCVVHVPAGLSWLFPRA